jgi:flavin reductase (DIM6/NTAB) family NADH-FMN oxidoreductase RutF
MNKEFFQEDILAMEKRYRATFINSLGGFKSVVLVGTRSLKQQENLAIFSSLFHIGANPALCGLIVRPSEVPRHTLNNILETSHYTINHINKAIYKQAHQTSARYPETESEFATTGLTPEYKQKIDAPFVKESTIQFACKLEQKIDLEINGTILLIGKIIYVNVPNSIITTDGFLNIEQAGTLTVSGLDSYHLTNKLERLSYAKPNTIPKSVE